MLLMVFDLQGLLLFWYILTCFQAIENEIRTHTVFYILLCYSFWFLLIPGFWGIRMSYWKSSKLKMMKTIWSRCEVFTHESCFCCVSAKPKIARKLRRTLKVQQEEVCQEVLGIFQFVIDVILVDVLFDFLSWHIFLIVFFPTWSC